MFDGYQEGMMDGRVRSRTDIGPPKVRRRTTTAIRPMQFQLTLSDAQLTTLKSFVDTTLLNGSLPFSFTDVHTGATITCQIGANMPSWRPISNTKWLVNMDLEVIK